MRFVVHHCERGNSVLLFPCQGQVGVGLADVRTRIAFCLFAAFEFEIMFRAVFVRENIRRIGVVYLVFRCVRDISYFFLNVQFPALSALHFIGIELRIVSVLTYYSGIVYMTDRNGHSAARARKVRVNERKRTRKVVDIARARRCGGRGMIRLVIFKSFAVQIRNIKSRSVNSAVIFAPIADKCVGGGVFVRADKDKTVVRCRIFIPFFSGAGYVI